MVVLQDEHLQIQANRRSGTNLTWNEVNNMPYTAKVSDDASILATIFKGKLIFQVLVEFQVISETLRRATILPWFSRKAAQDFEIDGISDSTNKISDAKTFLHIYIYNLL